MAKRIVFSVTSAFSAVQSVLHLSLHIRHLPPVFPLQLHGTDDAAAIQEPSAESASFQRQQPKLPSHKYIT